MKSNQLVSDFYDAYCSYLVDTWGLTDPVGSPGYGSYGSSAYRIFSPGLRNDELAKVHDLVPKGMLLPDSLLSFFLEFRFAEFVSPLIQFYPTMVPEFSEITLPVMRSLAALGLLAFATEDGGGLSFCVDFRFDAVPFPIVLCRPGTESQSIQVLGPVFSSFDSLLLVLKASFKGRTSAYVDGPANNSDLLFFRSLAEIDPEGFGGPGWQAHWSQWLLREQVPLSSLPKP